MTISILYMKRVQLALLMTYFSSTIAIHRPENLVSLPKEKSDSEALSDFEIFEFRAIVSVVATIASISLSLASIPTMRAIMADGTTGRRPLLPFSAQSVNGLIWLIYGYLVSNSELIITAFVAFVTGLGYSACFLSNIPLGANWLPGTLMHHGVAVISLGSGVMVLASYAPMDVAIDSLGKLGSVFCIVMFAAPLSSLRTVIHTRSTASMALSFTLGTTFNCTLWVAHGLLIDNPYIWLPNTVGLFAAALQLCLFVIFRNTPGKIENR